MFRVVRDTRKLRSFQNSFASDRAMLRTSSTLVLVLAFAAIRERHMWNNVHCSGFLLLGKLSCVVSGDLFEVASEIVVQRFFSLERHHFDYIQSKKFGES
jgi:hypothetical protein